jgi:hypothetical protein
MQSHLHHPTSSPPSYSRVQSHQRSDDLGSNVYYGWEQKEKRPVINKESRWIRKNK